MKSLVIQKTISKKPRDHISKAQLWVDNELIMTIDDMECEFLNEVELKTNLAIEVAKVIAKSLGHDVHEMNN